MLIEQTAATASLGQPFTVTVRITSGHYKATLYFRPARPGEAYRFVAMSERDGVFTATITPDASFTDGLEYHVKAVPLDGSAPLLSSGSGFSPRRVPVR
jgi:hypothetical protein